MFVNEVIITPPSASLSKECSVDSPTTISIENVINLTRNEAVDTGTTKNPQVNPVLSNASPTPTIRSNTISVASIESDVVSSVVDSDDEEYEDSLTGCGLKKLGQQADNSFQNNQVPPISPEIAVLLGKQIERDVAGEDGPKIASLSLTNSTDVTFGHKKFHTGHVTIQQVLVEEPSYDGKCNSAFENSNGHLNANQQANPPQNGPTPKDPPFVQIQKLIVNHKYAVCIGVIAILLIFIGIILGVVSAGGSTSDNRSSILNMISRDEWVAQPPNQPLQNLETPVARVIISHTATQNCTNRSMCILRTRVLQTFDMESRSLNDIRYNFLVGGDGNVYVGRGWDKVGAHSKGYNEISLGIALIGTFRVWSPSEEQLKATEWLLNEGVRLKKLEPNYRLYGSRQLDLTESPGDVLYGIINQWPHWSSDL